MTVKELIKKLNEIQDKNLEVFCEPYISLNLPVEKDRKFMGNPAKAFKIEEVACTEFKETNKLWVAIITNPFSENLLNIESNILELETEQ